MASIFKSVPGEQLLRNNFGWTLGGNLTYSVAQWVVLVVLAKLASPASVGQFVLGLSIAAPIILFTNLALRQVQATDARRDYAFAHYLALRMITTPLALLAISLVVFVVGYRHETTLVILAVGIAKAFEAIGDVFYGLFQQNERMDWVGQSLILKGVLSLAVFASLVFFTGNTLVGVFGLSASLATVLFLFDVRNGRLCTRRESGETCLPKFESSRLRELTSLTLPLGFAMLLISLNTNIPRYFLERLNGEFELGVFGAISYIVISGRTLVAAMGQAASPRLSQYYAKGDSKAFFGLMSVMVTLAAILGLVGFVATLLFGYQILAFLYRPEYAEHWKVLLWLMAAGSIQYVGSALGYGMTASRRFRVQPLIFGGSAIVAIISSAVLIPQYGIPGAAGVMLLVSFTQTTAVLLVNVAAFKALTNSDEGS